jgi:hypothetical protein
MRPGLPHPWAGLAARCGGSGNAELWVRASGGRRARPDYRRQRADRKRIRIEDGEDGTRDGRRQGGTDARPIADEGGPFKFV